MEFGGDAAFAANLTFFAVELSGAWSLALRLRDGAVCMLFASTVVVLLDGGGLLSVEVRPSMRDCESVAEMFDLLELGRVDVDGGVRASLTLFLDVRKLSL